MWYKSRVSPDSTVRFDIPRPILFRPQQNKQKSQSSGQNFKFPWKKKRIVLQKPATAKPPAITPTSSMVFFFFSTKKCVVKINRRVIINETPSWVVVYRRTMPLAKRLSWKLHRFPRSFASRPLLFIFWTTFHKFSLGHYPPIYQALERICSLMILSTRTAHVVQVLGKAARGVAPFKPVSPGLQTFLGIFIMRICFFFLCSSSYVLVVFGWFFKGLCARHALYTFRAAFPVVVQALETLSQDGNGKARGY